MLNSVIAGYKIDNSAYFSYKNLEGAMSTAMVPLSWVPYMFWTQPTSAIMTMLLYNLFRADTEGWTMQMAIAVLKEEFEL